MAILQHNYKVGIPPHHEFRELLYDHQIRVFKGYCIEENINRIRVLKTLEYNEVSLDTVPEDVKKHFGLIPIMPSPAIPKKKAKKK